MHFGAGYFELDLTKDLPGTEHLTVLPAAPTRPATPPKPTTPSRPTIEVAPANISVTTSASVSTHTQATDEAVVPEKFTPSNHGKLIVLHGLLLSVGFLLFLPIGALVARWCRTLVSHWFKVHWISNMLLGFPVITLGFLLGPLAVSSDGGGHFRGAHHVCTATYLMQTSVSDIHCTDIRLHPIWGLHLATIPRPKDRVTTSDPRCSRTSTNKHPPYGPWSVHSVLRCVPGACPCALPSIPLY